MTALHHSRTMVHAALAALLFAFACLPGTAYAADAVKGELTVFTDGGYTRLVFRLDEEVEAKASVAGAIMVLSFKKPIDVAVDRMNAAAPSYVSAARRDPDGSAIRIALARKIKVNLIPAGERLYVDLLPETWKGVMPGLPQEVIDDLSRRAREAERQLHQQRLAAKVAKPQVIRVKVARQPTFTRYVFEMPATANVVPERKDGKLTLNFDQQIRWDLADAKAALPATLESIESDTEFAATAVTFTLNGEPQVRNFREDRSIIVDVGLDGGKPKPPEGEGNAAVAPESGPAIEPPETVPVKDAAAPVQTPKDSAPPKIDAAAKAAESKPAPVAAAAPNAPKEARPASNPDAPVVVTLNRSGDNLRLDFPFAAPTPAAVFRRADMLWLVFDSTAKIDLASLSTDSTQIIRNAIVERGLDGEAIVRIQLARPRLASLDTDGPAWIVTIGDTVTVPTRPLGIARNIVGKGRASIVIPFENPRKIHRLTDPDFGDRLMVTTALAPARGFLKSQDFVELRTLPSTHGVVMQTIADDVTAELAVDKITVSRPGGLSISSTALSPQQVAPSFRSLTFDTQLWGFDRQAKFSDRQGELIGIAAAATESKRRQARLNLARFYLARDMAAEAKAVLEVAYSDQRGSEDVTGGVLKAIANVLLDRPDEALKELSNPQIGDQQDAPIWRAIAHARQGKWPEARDGFKNVDAAMGALPIELQRIAMLQALRSAIEVRDFTGATRMVNEFETIGVPAELEPSIAVLAGRLYEGLGRNEDALTNYRAASASKDRRAAAQGRLREIVLLLAAGEMPRKEVVHELETLTTVWRGDETEVEGLKLLAHIYRGRPLPGRLPCDAHGDDGASQFRHDPQDPG